MVTSSLVRAHLVKALEAELVGPYSEHEELDRAPSRTYLTGFLVPREDRNADPLNDADDDTETEEAEADGDEEVGGGEGARLAGEARSTAAGRWSHGDASHAVSGTAEVGTRGGTTAPKPALTPRKYRAGYQIRTGDLQLGKQRRPISDAISGR